MGCEKSGDGYLCPVCRAAHFQLNISTLQSTTLHTLGPYRGLLRETVLAVKSKGLKALAQEVAVLSGESLKARPELLLGVSQVMPVPGSLEGTRFRGFSFPNILAEAISRACSLEFPDDKARARFRRWAKSSKGATAGDRLSRLQDSPSTDQLVADAGGLLLVDDVVTTGATLGHAVEQARAMGYSKVVCFAISDYREED